MPLTPTEHRQRDREKNISLVKAGSNSINQFKKQRPNENFQEKNPV